MLRKLCRPALLAGLLGLSLGLETGRAQGAPATTAAPAAPPPAAIWAATARYVYADDPDLRGLLPELQQTIDGSSLRAFSRGIDEAVVLEHSRLRGQKHVLKFQELYKTIQAQSPGTDDPAALVKAIVGKLDDNKERMADPARRQQLAQLEQQLVQLAAGTAPAPPAAGNPMDQIGAAPAEAASPRPAPAATSAPVAPPVALAAAPTSPLLWLALAMSGLSLLGVVALWLRKPVGAPAPASPQPERHSRHSAQRDFTWDEVKKYVDRQLAGRPVGAAAPLAPAPGPPVPDQEPAAPMPVPGLALELPAPAAPAPAPRVRVQYVSEAPLNHTFPARALSDQLGSYSMFAIESSEEQPGQGTFSVTGNLASHVRDHRSVLEPVCEYAGGYPLGNETRVVTEQPGLVQRRGDDWVVTQPARVRFE